MLVADDENQGLRLYDRSNSGLPVNTFDFTASLGLPVSGKEVDLEAAARVGNRIYWMGSQSNSDSGSSNPNRDRIFATDISGADAATSLSYVGRYDFLREDIIAWDANNGHGLGANFFGLSASATSGIGSKQSNGYNIEGLEFAPNNTTAYVAFRAPQEPTTGRTNALIIPVTNFTSLIGNTTLGSATFGAPIQLDLGGRGIREIRKNANNQYVIIAGPAGDATGVAPADFRLYTWTGLASDVPVLRSADLTALNSGGSFESIVEVPDSLTDSSQLQLLVDNGTTVFYNNGLAGSDIPNSPNFQKSRSELVTLGTPLGLPTKISVIQGNGSTAALTGTQTIEGIVTRAFLSATKLNGFYVQEEDADSDGNATTSEAIFVYDPSGLFTGNVGDKVRITGTAGEFASGTTGSSLTQLSSLTSVINLGASTLPTTVNVQLPTTSVTDLERYEGMLVNLGAASGNLTVTENYQLGRYGQVILAVDGASNQAGTDARLDQYTQFNTPSVSGYTNYLAELANRKIYLDDGSGTQNVDPTLFARGGNPLSATNTLRSGDTVANITGVLDERFEGYRIQTSTGVNFTPTNDRPVTPPAVGGTLKVASFNVLNYFNDLDTNTVITFANGLQFEPRGANNATELTRQRDKTVNAIIATGADVLGLTEIENNGYGSSSAIQDLVNGLNAIAGAGTYAFINPGSNSLGTDAISVAFVYKTSKVNPVGAAAFIPNAYGSGAFDIVGRKPLAQTFQQISTGEQFTAVINHFKSKGSSSGGVGDADAGDGQGLSNGTRTRQSQDLASWLATKPTGTNDPDYILLGDFNAYAKEDPLTTLATAGYNNLSPNTSYSYVFNGQVGALDHALGNSFLNVQITGADEWHINADEPTVLDYNTEFKSANQISSLYSSQPFRTSDHDPVLVGLNLRPINTAPAIAINTALPFDANPFDLSGWLFGSSTNPPNPPILTVNVAANQSSLNTTANSTTQAGFLRNDRVLDRSLGYTLSFTTQILAESHANTDRNADGLDDRAGFSATVIGNDLKGLDIGFFSDRLWVQEGGTGANLLTQAESISFDTTKLATYTLTVLGNTYTLQSKEIGGSNATATLYGSLRDYTASLATVTLSGQTVAPYNTPNFIFFGDNATSTNASFTLKDISINDGKTTIALPSIAENTANDAIVGSINATDINGDILTYSITSGNTNGAFSINASTGQITVANRAALDFETTPSFSLTVGVSDGSLTDSATVTVNLTNVNEAPTAVSLNNQVTAIAENTSTTTRIKVADIAITDDALGTNTLSVSGTDAIFFEVVGTGLYIKANTVLNYEAKTSYSVTVNVDDSTVGSTPDATANFTLNVTDIGVLSINNTSVTEGNTGSTNATFTVSLSDPYAGTVSIDYATADGTAYSTSNDYTATSGTLTFSGGVISQTVNVAVLGDTYNEANETFKLNLSNPTNATLANTFGTATIIDNDPLPTFSISSLQLAEGDSGTKNAQLNIQLSSASGQIVSVNYTTVDGTATSGSDYTTTSGTLSFAAGNTLMSVLVPILGDTSVEGDETFSVTLNNPSTGATLSNQSTGTVTILNDDSVSGSTNLTLTGTTGNDVLTGGLGKDIITGLGGNDSLDGSGGDDTLIGGVGADILTGGLGSDRFIYSNFNDSLFTATTNNSYDRIRDFNPAQGDRIGLSNAPTSAYNAGTITATSLNNAIAAAFNDADPITTGNQTLGANQAVFFTYGATSLKSTYLVVNDSSATFSAASDLCINITGLVGTVPLGSLTVNNYFSTL
jgi:predicted extracellular nuclease